MDTPPRLSDRRSLRSAAPVEPDEVSDLPSSTDVPVAAADRAGGELPLWHVSVTFAGAAMEMELLDAALRRIVDAQPFLASVRYAADRAEISYWDEAEDVDDAAALGLRLWAEHRRVAELPDWRPVGIEVVDRDTYHARGQRLPPPTGLGQVRPW